MTAADQRQQARRDQPDLNRPMAIPAAVKVHIALKPGFRSGPLATRLHDQEHRVDQHA